MQRLTFAKLSGVLAVSCMLASCFSLDVTFDVRDPEALLLGLEYSIARDVWELGVFDPGSPERAIPVSRRDAVETAGLYPDVELAHYRIEEGDSVVTVSMEYQAGSVESLANLWGRVGTDRLQLDPDDQTMTIPVTQAGPETDAEQRGLIESSFRGQTLTVRIVAPTVPVLTAPDGTAGVVEPATEATSTVWRTELSAALLTRRPILLNAAWGGSQ